MTAKKKKDGGQRNPIMPRPSYMWIYVLVAAFIIGYSLSAATGIRSKGWFAAATWRGSRW